jgi:hypothetical protein
MKLQQSSPTVVRRVGRTIWQHTPDELTERQKRIIKQNWRNRIYGLNCLSLLSKEDKTRATNDCIKLFAAIEGLPQRETKKGGTYTSSNEIKQNRFGFYK